MEIYFILVKPAIPENIGASARAIKTMGFRSLRLVKPINYPHEKATWLAHGSADILENAKIFDNFDEATKDLDFLVGTSAKKRRIKFDFYEISEVENIIARKGSYIKKIGLVFGREESGLTNSELSACDLVSYIPLANPYPSLNLSQAVMLYAYHLSAFHKAGPTTEAKANIQGIIELKQKSEVILKNINIAKGSVKFNRIMERFSLLSETDLNLLHTITNEILKNSTIIE